MGEQGDRVCGGEVPQLVTPKTQPKPLSCGGKGPCCHVGYSHRHCEHCDEVIATAANWAWPQQIYPGTAYPSPFWYRSGTFSHLDSLNAAAADSVGIPMTYSNFLQMSGNANAEALPAHTCEARG